MKKHVPRTVFVSLVVLSALVAPAQGQTAYVFEVAARTGVPVGGASPLALGRGPSINDAGKVALIVRDQANLQGRLIVVTREGVVERNYPVASPATIADFVEINNVDQVVWHQGFEDGLVGHVQRLDSTTGGVTFGSGSLTPAFQAPFDIVRPWATLNNSGRGVFSAVNGTSTVLATRAGGTGDHDTSGPTTATAVLFPMITDNNMTIVRAGDTMTSPLILFDDETLNNAFYIAESPDFTAIGAAPGISDDSAFIAFMGDHGTQGDGIFGEIGGGIPIFKIAGLSGDGTLDPGETFTDSNGNGAFDAGEQDVGFFSAFTLEPRTGVNRTLPGPTKSYTIAYIAFDLVGKMGLYTSRVDITNPSNPIISPPSLVIKVDDTIPGSRSAVSNIRVYDPINNGGELVFWVDMADGGQAIVRACPDSDGDALPDCWEREGIKDANGDVIVDLPAMGADPNIKDIFVEVDYMDCAFGGCASGIAHSHKPWDVSIDIVIRAFFNAPVDCDEDDPKDCKGIRLHVDHGPSTVMHPETADPVQGDVWGNLSRSNVRVDGSGTLVPDGIAHRDDFGRAGNACDDATVTQALIDLRNRHFTPERRFVFHYVVFVHNRCNATNGGATVPGIGSFITLGRHPMNNQVGTAWEQAGTFMHELGHDLGLQHGGSDTMNWKPNYLSVMSYAFQLRGLTINPNHSDHPSASYPFAIGGYFDYSRFDSLEVAELIEDGGLDEMVGLNGRSPNPSLRGYGTYHYCALGIEEPVDLASEPIDWNCNNALERAVTHDVNVGMKLDTNSPTLTTLRSHNDWDNLVYNNGSIGGDGLGGDVAPELIAEEEVPLLPGSYAVEVLSPASLTVSPGESTTYDFSIHNVGQNADTYTLSATSSQGWANVDAAQASMMLEPGQESILSIEVTIPASASEGDIDELILEAKSQTNPLLLDLASVRTTVSPEGDVTPMPDGSGCGCEVSRGESGNPWPGGAVLMLLASGYMLRRRMAITS